MRHESKACLPVMAMLALVVASFATEPVQAEEDELADRVAMVRTLLFESSAARRIEASENEAAQQKRAQAIELFEAAREPGDVVEREAKLKEAVSLLYQASAAAPPSRSAEEKGRNDFARKRESLVALLEAHERIMEEKGKSETHAELLDEVEADLAAADSLLAEGSVEIARERLERAYDVTRLAVEHSRTGETLKRELKFETAEDEYHYELDRNETHRMLLTVLLKDKLDNERVRSRVEGFVETADVHRANADDMAREKRFEEAIEELERSTVELVKAIRGAGVYIPG